MPKKPINLYKNLLRPLSHRELDDNFVQLESLLEGDRNKNVIVIPNSAERGGYTSLLSPVFFGNGIAPVSIADNGNATAGFEEFQRVYSLSTGVDKLVAHKFEQSHISPDGAMYAGMYENKLEVVIVDGGQSTTFNLPPQNGDPDKGLQKDMWWMSPTEIVVISFEVHDARIYTIDKENVAITERDVFSNMIEDDHEGFVKGRHLIASSGDTSNEIRIADLSTGASYTVPSKPNMGTEQFYQMMMLGFDGDTLLSYGVMEDANEIAVPTIMSVNSSGATFIKADSPNLFLGVIGADAMQEKATMKELIIGGRTYFILEKGYLDAVLFDVEDRVMYTASVLGSKLAVRNEV